MKESAASSREGAARWLAIHDELLRGLAHALSNRVATVAAAAYLIESQERPSAASAQLLRIEADQLEGILHLVRLLPRGNDGDAEPVMAADAARTAIELHGHHAVLHGIPCELAKADDVQPAWGDHIALPQAIAVGLGVAKRAAVDQRGVRIAVSSTDDVVRLAIECPFHPRGTVHGVDDALDIEAINWLLAATGGDAVLTDGGCTIEVPSLSAARRLRDA